MAIPPLGDARLDLLVGVYIEAARSLARLLSELMDLSESPRRFLIFQNIQRQLRQLESASDVWSQRFVREFFEEADIKAVASLRSAGITATFSSVPNFQAVQSLINNLRGTLDKGHQSIELLTSKIFRNPAVEREFPDLAFKVRRQVAVGLSAAESTSVIRRQVGGLLRERFRDSPVSIIGASGRRFTFPLDYYAGMITHNTKRQATTVATLVRAREGAHDLVRVTANPSKGGDYCDAYRGRVFSISGAHPRYPPLAGTPNGGPPFHPWCKHSLGIFVPQFYTPEQQREFADVDERFLMQPNESNPNRVVRNWWSASRGEKLEPLRTI